MGNKSYRIKTTAGGSDKYLKVKLEQEVDLIEILSVKITQKDIYSSFNSDFGVLVGRVIANGGVGIPNAKISIFIPISEDDKVNSAINAIYPYTNPRDQNSDGVRYNLLPRVAVNNPFNAAGSFTPPVPVGTFPTKEEIITNDTFLEVYKKYYKFTTVTNNSGDYMIYGVPVGIQTVHMSVDVTDIGNFSMTPATMISQLGYSEQLFSNNKVKFSTDLDTLPNIDTQNISVDIRPFWGDKENFEIGITRQDFKIRATLVSSVTVFGAGFTDAEYAVWGRGDFFGDRDDAASAMSQNESVSSNVLDSVKYNTSLSSRRNGAFKIEVYGLAPSVPTSALTSTIGFGIFDGEFDTEKDLVLLEKSQYSEILQDGMFLLTLPCNRNKKIVNEFGELVQTTDNDPNGIFTEFIGSFIIDYGEELSIINNPTDKARTDRNRSDRSRLKIPQFATFNETFSSERPIHILSNPEAGFWSPAQRMEFNERWRRQVYKFEGAGLYSVSRYNGITFMEETGSYWKYNLWTKDTTHDNNNAWRQAGSLASLTNVGDVGDTVGFDYDPSIYNFPFNTTTNYNKTGGGGTELITNVPVFGAEWLNFCLYFPQFYNYSNGTWDVVPGLTSDFGNGSDMTIENNYRVLGFRRDLSYFLRSDIHPSTFIKVPKADLITILQNIPDKRGFKSTDIEFSTTPLVGTYYGNSSSKHFFRGINNADIIAFLVENGIISA